MGELTRFTNLIAGFDCERHPCGRNGCGTQPGRGHGVGSDTWDYAVSDGNVALSLTVFSGDFPDTVPPNPPALQKRFPLAANLVVHTSFPTDLEQLLKDERAPCTFLDGGCYANEGSTAAARTFFADHGEPQFEQPESFWEAFVETWAHHAGRALLERVDETHARCGSCEGRGTVERSQLVVARTKTDADLLRSVGDPTARPALAELLGALSRSLIIDPESRSVADYTHTWLQHPAHVREDVIQWLRDRDEDSGRTLEDAYDAANLLDVINRSATPEDDRR